MIRRFFKNAKLLVAAELLSRFKGLFIIPFLTKYFGALNYGIWSQAGVLLNTFLPLMVLGTDSAIIRFLPGRPLDEQKRIFSGWMLFLFLVGSFGCGVLYCLKGPMLRMFFGETTDFLPYTLLFLGALMTTLLFNSMKNWFRIQNDANILSGIVLIQTVLNIFVVVYILIRHESVYRLVILTLSIDVAISLFLALRISFSTGWSFPDFSLLPALLKYGFPLIPTAYAMWCLNWMDRFILIRHASLQQLGVYSFVYSLGYMVIQIFVNPIWMMYPNLATEFHNQGDNQRLQKLFNYSTGLILVLTLPAIAGLFTMGKTFVALLSTAEFVPGAPLIAIVTTGYLFHMLASYCDISLGHIHRQYLSTVSIGLACGVSLLFNFVLIPKYSILGAAVARSIGFFAQLIFSYAMVSRYKILKTNFKFPLKVGTISILMGLAIHVLQIHFNHPGLFTFGIIVLTGVFLYGAMLFIFKVISFDFVKLAFELLTSR